MTKRTCYLLAWLSEEDGRIVCKFSGFCSEGAGAFTHELNKEAPAELFSVTSKDGFEAALNLAGQVLDERAKRGGIWEAIAKEVYRD